MATRASRRRSISPRKKPVQARAQGTVDAILEAAAQVFQAQGYARGTTNHIARRAGISIGSLYDYFPSKDAVLVALARKHLEDGLACVYGLLVEAVNGPPEPLGALLRRIVHAMVLLHAQAPRLHQVLFEETPLPGILRKEIAQADALLGELVRGLLATREDVRRKDSKLTAYFVVHLVESMTHGFVLHPPPDCDVEAFVEEAALILERYLTAS